MLFFVRPHVDKVKRTPILVLGGAADWSIATLTSRTRQVFTVPRPPASPGSLMTKV
jgi:hypothetical protein